MREELTHGDINRAWNLFREIKIALNFNFPLTCACEFDMINVCDVLVTIYAYARYGVRISRTVLYIKSVNS